MFSINCFRINGSWNKTELQKKNKKKTATTKKHSRLKLMVGITRKNHIQSLISITFPQVVKHVETIRGKIDIKSLTTNLPSNYLKILKRKHHEY